MVFDDMGFDAVIKVCVLVTLIITTSDREWKKVNLTSVCVDNEEQVLNNLNRCGVEGENEFQVKINYFNLPSLIDSFCLYIW